MSATTNRIQLAAADKIATSVLWQLEPHCERIEIAGSVRRRRPTVGDLEIVCIPSAYAPLPLFASGIATVVNQWPRVKGELPCKYTQRLLPQGIALDLFMVKPEGFGLQLAIRTGSARWSHEVLARSWVRAGCRSEGGLLRRQNGTVVPARTERELFDRIGLAWVAPEDRE